MNQGDSVLPQGDVDDDPPAIAGRRQVDWDHHLATAVLRVLNRGAGDLGALIREVLELIQAGLGFDAVGVRLQQGPDFPYFVQSGFAAEFIQEENSLLIPASGGPAERACAAATGLECTCGLVLSGRGELSRPYFSPGGSFWTNQSSALLALPAENDPRLHPRNRCIHQGYLSVALVPVRAGETIIGLLQLNDRRDGRFNPESIAFLERLAEYIGMGIQRKQTEEALRAAKSAAEEANAAKDKFLALLSHELRTPLSPVLIAASTAENDTRLPDDVRADMALIRRSVELEARLIDDLLDFSGMSGGALSLQRRPLDAHAPLRTAIEIASEEARAKQIELTSALAAAHTQVEADGGRLQQIFWNLLRNALRFTPEHGHIAIRSANPAPGQLRIEVVDNGAGLDVEALAHVFDPFVQASAHVSRQFGGLGLGLALSKALVELHGGTIRAESDGPGRGARFVVEVPVAPSCGPTLARTPNSGASSDTPGQGLRMFLVEDHEPTAMMLARILRQMGHQVATAGTMSEGVARLEAEEYDLLISDIGLPDGDGHELMRRARARRPGLRGLAVSGFGTDADMARSREAGFAEHLVKPVDLGALQAAIKRVANG